MSRAVENNDVAKELWEALSDATALESGTKTAVRSLIGAAIGTDVAAQSHTHVAADVTDLGDSATLDVGTAAGTVAAGDDARFGSESGELVFFLEDEADPIISGYKVMDNPAQLETEAFVTQSTVAEGQIIQEWITDAGLPGTTFIPEGAYQLHLNAYKTGGSKSTHIYNEIYKRNLAGTETLLGTTALSIALTGVEVALPAFSVYIAAQTLLATDRIVTKTRMSLTGGGSNPTSVTVGYSGSTAARLTLPAQAVDVTDLLRKSENLSGLASAATARTNLGLGTAATLNSSQLGGSLVLIQTDSSGNITTGPFNGILGGGTVGGFADAGNINIPDLQGLRWLKRDGTQSNAGLYHWENHDLFGGETILQSPWRIALIPSGPIQLFKNDAGRYPRKLIMSSGGASAADPAVEYMPSGALSFQATVWTGAASVRDEYIFQSKHIDTSGTNSVLQLFANASVSGEDGGGGIYTSGRGDAEGSLAAEFTPDGIWHPGSAPTFDTLTDGATITQTCSIYKTVQAAKVTLGGNRTLAFSGLIAGMRGVIYVTQDGAGSRTLTPSGGAALGLSSTGGYVDRVAWDFDGIFVNFTVTQNINQTVVISDSDAQTFVTAASISDNTQKVAINTLVESLKAASLWTRWHALYPFVGGSSSSHAVNLKNPGTYDITWTGSVTHNSNGITGNASDARGNTAIDLNALSAQNNASGYVYCRTQTPTASSYFFGANTASTRFGGGSSGSSFAAYGPNDNTAGTLSAGVSSDWRKHMCIDRSGASAKSATANALRATSTQASVAAPNQPIYLLCRNASGSPANYTNANLAFAAFGQSLSEAEWTAFRAIIDAFQTTLSRANP